MWESGPLRTVAVTLPDTTISQDWFGLHILGPVETNIGGSGKPLIWPQWTPRTLRTLDSFGQVPPNYTYQESLSWGWLEATQGQYDWVISNPNLLDEILDKYIAQGVSDVMYTFDGIPTWARADHDQHKLPDTPSTINTFLTALLSHCRTRGLPIKYVEGINEWNASASQWNDTVANLVLFQQQIYNAAKAFDPQIQVLSPPPNDILGYTYLDSYLSAGGAAYCDIISFHDYNGASADGNGVQAGYDNYQRVMASYGVTKPLWSSEGSSLSSSANANATWLAITYLIAASSGLGRKYFYAYDTASDKLWDSPIATPPNGALNSAGTAYIQVRNWLVGATVIERHKIVGTVHSVKFKQGNIVSLCVWDSSGSSSYTPSAEYTFYDDLSGNSTAVSGAVTIGTNPLRFRTG